MEQWIKPKNPEMAVFGFFFNCFWQFKASRSILGPVATFSKSFSPYGGRTVLFRPDLMFCGPGFSCSGSPKQALKLPARPSTPETCLMRLHEASSGLAWPGLAWPGLAWPGLGLAWPGLAWPWPGLACLAWPGPGLAWGVRRRAVTGRAAGGRAPGGSQKVLGPCPPATPTHTPPRLLSRAAGGQ